MESLLPSTLSGFKSGALPLTALSQPHPGPVWGLQGLLVGSMPLQGPHFLEPAFWESAAEIQEQQRLAEAVGGLHKLLPLFLQITPGRARTG